MMTNATTSSSVMSATVRLIRSLLEEVWSWGTYSPPRKKKMVSVDDGISRWLTEQSCFETKPDAVT